MSDFTQDGELDWADHMAEGVKPVSKWLAWAMYDEGEDWPHAHGVETIVEAETAEGAEAEYIRIHGDHFHGEDYINARPATDEDIKRIEALDRIRSR